MPTFTDQMGFEVQLNERPQRIVSLVPSLTELLADLGLSDQIVGLTHFCVYPKELYKNKERIGGTKKARIEQIKALEPDLIIANKEENEKEQVEALKAFCPVWVSKVYDIPTALTMIKKLSEVVGKPTEGAAMTERIRAGMANLPQAPNLKTLYMIWRKPYMAAGGDTFIHEMLRQIGLENVLKDVNRYPEITSHDIKAYNPDLVLLSSEPYPFKEKHMVELQSLLPSAQVKLVDGSLFSWYGSRMEKALPTLGELSQELADTWQKEPK
jgi:ABC-type Fe3+-hydroxamate transport system substrate-binding protein